MSATQLPLSDPSGIDWSLYEKGQALAKTAQELDAEILQASKREKNLRLGKTLQSVAHTDDYDLDLDTNLSEAHQKLTALTHQKQGVMRSRIAIAETLASAVLANAGGMNAADAAAYGRAGEMVEDLGLQSQASPYYETAEFLAWGIGDVVKEAQFRLQVIRMMNEGDDQWRMKLAALQKLSDYVAMIVSGSILHADGDGVKIALPSPDFKTQGKFHVVLAQALHDEVEIRVQRGMGSSDDEFLKLKQTVLARMDRIAALPMDANEARLLAEALASLQGVQVMDAAHASREGDLDVARSLGAVLKAEAAHARAMYKAFGTADEGLSHVLEMAHYLRLRQSGLPVDAVYEWWSEVYGQYKGVNVFESQAAALRKKVPHFFTDVGELRARTDLAYAPDADMAVELESQLHISTGSVTENVLIETPSSILGMSAGAKLFAGLGTLCGPAAGVCVPVGGALGGVAGVVAGDQVVKALHREAITEMEEQARLAGMALVRVTPEEALMAATWAYAGYAVRMIMAGGIGSLGAQAESWSLRAAARAAVTRQAWFHVGRYFVGGVRNEASYAANWGKAAWSGLKGFVTEPTPNPSGFIRPDLDRSFEVIYARLSPTQVAKYPRARWREIFNDLVERGDTKLFKAPKSAAKLITGKFDGFWKPVADFVDNNLHFADLDAFVSGRFRAAAARIALEVPEIAENDLALLGQKELLRHAFRLETAPELIGASAKLAAPTAGTFAKAWKFWCDSIWSDHMARSYRLGWAPYAFDKYFLKKNQDGTFELSFGDGRVDTWWGLSAKWLGWASLTTWAGFNTLNGGLIGNAMKGTTFVGFQGLSALAASDANLDQLEGAADEQVLFLGGMMLLASGKSANGGPLLRVLARTPLAQRIPSLSSFVTRFEPTSTLASPNYFRPMPGRTLPVNVLGLTTLSLPYNIAMSSGMRAMTGKALLDSDSYANWQIGVKFFFVGTILNPTQWALGTNTAQAQGGTRLLGIFFDIIPAMAFPPYYSSKAVMHATLDRMAGEGPVGQAKVMRHFFSQPDNWMDTLGIGGGSTVNRSYDLVGVLKRGNYFQWTNPKTWHSGWRWEPDGLSAWFDAMETGYTDKATGQEMLGVDDRHPDVYVGAVAELYHMFQNPDEWMGNEYKARGMVIAATMAKWQSGRYARGEGAQFKPFFELVDNANSEWRQKFWDIIPNAHSKAEFLKRAAEIQEMPMDEVLELLGGSYKVQSTK